MATARSDAPLMQLDRIGGNAYSTMPATLLSVLIPLYNEEEFVAPLIERVLQAPLPEGMEREIIVVDDGSRDGSAEIVAELAARYPEIRVLRHERNRGKSAAIRTAIDQARGDYSIIQDADLEYDPTDLPAVVGPVLRGEARAVYGSRVLGGQQGRPWYSPYRLAVAGLNRLARLLYGQRLTDHATCYKALPTELWRALDLRAERFEVCAEVTAKLGRLGIPIQEVGISYRPRTRAEGKKIGWRDGLAAARTFIRWRFAAVAPSGPAEIRVLPGAAGRPPSPMAILPGFISRTPRPAA